MSLCKICAELLSDVVAYQLGRTPTILNDIRNYDSAKNLQLRQQTPDCPVCAVFEDNILRGETLDIRRSRAAKDVTTANGLTWKGSSIMQLLTVFGGDEIENEEIAGALELVNDIELASVKLLDSAALVRPSTHNITVRGPFADDPTRRNQEIHSGMLDYAGRWIQDCEKSHASCLSGKSQVSFPSRLLDLGNGQSNSQTRLISGTGLVGNYAALSHCWGSGPTLTTMKNTLLERQRGIPWHKLPRLFRDAAQFTRGLGLRYLWIDSLCIVQDDIHEWEQEACRMAEVYSNAYITLAALGARDSTHSLYPHPHIAKMSFSEPGSKQIAGWNFIVHPKGDAITDVISAPLNNRAWVLQEMILSRRTIYFSYSQLFWHCNQLAESTDRHMVEGNGLLAASSGWPYGADWIRSFFGTKYSANTQQAHKERNEEVDHRDLLKLAWWNMIEDYTQRKMTNLSDKLVALAGVVAILKRRIRQDDYYSGLWRFDMPYGLLWYTEDELRERPPELAEVPTWSWASLDARIHMPFAYGVEPWPEALAEVLDINVSHADSTSASGGRRPSLSIQGTLLSVAYNQRSLHVNGERGIFVYDLDGQETGTAGEKIGYGFLDFFKYAINSFSLDTAARNAVIECE